MFIKAHTEFEILSERFVDRTASKWTFFKEKIDFKFIQCYVDIKNSLFKGGMVNIGEKMTLNGFRVHFESVL